MLLLKSEHSIKVIFNKRWIRESVRGPLQAVQEGCTLVDIQCSWSHSRCTEPLCCDPLSSLISPSCPARGCVSKLQRATRSFLLPESYRTASSALAPTSLNLLFLLPQETSHLGVWLWPPEPGLSKPLPGKIWFLKLRNSEPERDIENIDSGIWDHHGSLSPPEQHDFGLGHMTCFDQWIWHDTN